MYIVHVILNEPYTFNFTDKYSLKYMKSRSMKYIIAIIYTDELLILRDSRYNYLFKEGISKIKGGLKVLKDMNYPKEILDNTKL